LFAITTKMIDSKRQNRVTWVNIPITKTVHSIANIAIDIQQQNNNVVESPKKVRWSEELTQIKEISPRYVF